MSADDDEAAVFLAFESRVELFADDLVNVFCCSNCNCNCKYKKIEQGHMIGVKNFVR